LAELPEVDGAEYILAYLMEVGPVSHGGMGMAPISYQEIQAWSTLTGTNLSPWDSLMLRQLSRAYVNQYNESKDPHSQAPYEEAMTLEQKRVAVVAGFKGMLRKSNG